jgi:hypothetical protein
MKSTLDLSAVGVLPCVGSLSKDSSAPPWEYCFVLQDEWSPISAELTQLAAAGWFVVSSRTRLDNQREYLLKRPRK